jgi:hypothetical protein
MYHFSRAIYRELAQDIIESDCPWAPTNHHAEVLRACESAVERLATDRHYFARPARTLFNDIRMHFPMSHQYRVYRVVEQYMHCADELLSKLPQRGYDVNGNPIQCRATTRKGTPCQRMPLPHNGYCPSHQHLAETEQTGAAVVAGDTHEITPLAA